MKFLRPKLVFEFGTFVGRTTQLLALNSPSDCAGITIDLEPRCVKHKIVEAFLGTSEDDEITQLHGDSSKFDFRSWYGKCDFIRVDSWHEYEYVITDTKNAMKLCSEGGWVGWYDYRHTAWWSGVTRCVRQIHRQ